MKIMQSHVTHCTTLYLVTWRQFDSQECIILTLIGMNKGDVWMGSSVVLLIELERIKGKSKTDQQCKSRTNTRLMLFPNTLNTLHHVALGETTFQKDYPRR